MRAARNAIYERSQFQSASRVASGYFQENGRSTHARLAALLPEVLARLHTGRAFARRSSEPRGSWVDLLPGFLQDAVEILPLFMSHRLPVDRGVVPECAAVFQKARRRRPTL